MGRLVLLALALGPWTSPVGVAGQDSPTPNVVTVRRHALPPGVHVLDARAATPAGGIGALAAPSPDPMGTWVRTWGTSNVAAPAAEEAPPDIPAGKVGGASASGGSTEVATTDEFSTAEKPAETLEDVKINNLDISAGALLNTGNARNFAGTFGLTTKIQRSRHRFGGAAAVNYATAALPQDRWRPSTFNVQGRARYDAFFAKRWVAYFNSTARHDRFAGLNLRVNAGPGVGLYFLAKEKHQVWAEVGYDFQYDLRRDEARGILDGDGNPVFGSDGVQLLVRKYDFRNAARVFLGYSNRLDERVSFDAGIEYLQGFVRTPTFTVAQQARVNLETMLSVALFQRLSLATSFVLRFDSGPLPGIRRVDTATALSLVYRLF